MSVIYNGKSFYLDDKNYEQESFFNRSDFVNALIMFSLYTLLYLWSSSRLNKLSEGTERLGRDIAAGQAELASTRKEALNEIGRLRATQLRLRLILQRRITDLAKENEIWRKFFIAIYTALFSSPDEAERAMAAILKRLVIQHSGGRKLRDIPEDEFIEMLFDNNFAQKIADVS